VRTVALIGLILNIAGTTLVWRYGLPENISRSGAIHLVLGRVDEAEQKKAKLYDRLSNGGMLLIVLGFGFQALALYMTGK
jgi:hypothetical protein